MAIKIRVVAEFVKVRLDSDIPVNRSWSSGTHEITLTEAQAEALRVALSDRRSENDA